MKNEALLCNSPAGSAMFAPLSAAPGPDSEADGLSEKRLTATTNQTEDRQAAYSGSLQRILNDYAIVHTIPGRLRLRPRVPRAGTTESDALQRLLESAFPGAAFTISAGTGSILVLLPADSGVEPAAAPPRAGQS